VRSNWKSSCVGITESIRSIESKGSCWSLHGRSPWVRNLEALSVFLAAQENGFYTTIGTRPSRSGAALQPGRAPRGHRRGATHGRWRSALLRDAPQRPRRRARHSLGGWSRRRPRAR
jgi:hypothetical protein